MERNIFIISFLLVASLQAQGWGAFIAQQATSIFTSRIATSAIETQTGGPGFISTIAGETAGKMAATGINSLVEQTVPNMDAAKQVARGAAQTSLNYYLVPFATQSLIYLTGATNPLAALGLGLASSFATSTAVNHGVSAIF